MLSADRWQLVERVFHEALGRPPAERPAFIESSCGGDAGVRREVESLLAADTSRDPDATPMERVAADWAADTATVDLAGREIGGYRVVSLLGEGGMGEVYLADDLSLGRRVALKLLPQQFTSDPARGRRFTEEARAASALNHPNIITVHHIGEFDQRRFIVTEYIDGETLRSRIAGGPLPESDAVDITVQAATALRAAHDAGIIHRDIKPENLMIRRDGYVKVLDFGLAKLAPDEQMGAAGGPSQPGPPRTRVGAVLGTPNYMAPEQALGAAVDARADIFSLSVVLHEMVTGTLPPESSGDPQFVGPHRAEPSPALARILGRGLAIDPAARYQRIDDLIHDLEALRAPTGGGWAAPLGRARVPLAAAAIAVITALMGWSAFRLWSTPLVSSLAVLPLANASGDPNLDYLGDGLAEGVISKLSQLPNLKVMARSTAFQFKGREGDPVTVGRELRVDAVLAGRVVPQGDTADVELQLVEVSSGTLLWSEGYTLRPAAASAIEEEIAGRITARLRLPSVAGAPLMAPEAHTLYLKARYQLNKRTPDGLRQAQLLYDQSLERDPDNAVLHAGLAETWALIGAYSILPPRDSFPRAIAAARNALERDESLAEARTTLALCLFLYEWNWRAAEAEFLRAAQTRPGYATAHHWFGEYLMARGRTEEAVAALGRARALDPLSLVIAVDQGRAYYFGHRFAEARQECQRALDVSPDFAPAVDCLAQVAVQEGRYDEAVAGYDQVSRLWGADAGLPGGAVALARAGRRAEAEAIWAELTAAGRPGYVQLPALVYVLAALGRKDEAFHLLDEARLARANNIPYLKTDARVDSLRDDPRWAEFARQVGLD
jgi:serine/threonine-protein kinase